MIIAALIIFVVIKMIPWFQTLGLRREFWEFFDCYHLAGSWEHKNEIGLVVSKKVSMLHDSCVLLKNELKILDEKIDLLLARHNPGDRESDEGIIFNPEITNLFRERIERRECFNQVRRKFEKAHELAGFMGYRKEVQCLCSNQ